MIYKNSIDKENYNLEKALAEYLLLLEKREYFDAHEILEEAWHPMRRAKHPLRNLVKGLINASIAFEHLKRNRNDAYRKAKTVICSYKRHQHICVEGTPNYLLFKKVCRRVDEIKESLNL